MDDNSSESDVIVVDLEEYDAEDDEIVEVAPGDDSPQEQEQEEPQEQSEHSLEQKQEQELEQSQEQEQEDLQDLQNPEINSSQTPENPQSTQKKIQQCLALLLHAQRCNIVQEETSEVQIECIQPHCCTIKLLLAHLKSCETQKSCNIPHCSSSRMLLRHWDTCKREDCPLCTPLRRRFNIQTQSEGNPRRKSMNSRLLPNPFAQLKRSRDLPGESWDDDPIIEFESVSVDPGESARVHSLNVSAANSSKSNFEWVSTAQRSRKWRNRKNFGSNKSRNSSRSRGRGYSFKKRGDKGRKNHFGRQSEGNYGDKGNFGAEKRNFEPRKRNFEPEKRNFEPEKRNFEPENQNLEFGTEMNTREQMLMLVHAFKCRGREANGQEGCKNATCKSTKQLLEHMKGCENTVRCWIPRCISSKRILIHVNECRDGNCRLCSPLAGSITK